MRRTFAVASALALTVSAVGSSAVMADGHMVTAEPGQDEANYRAKRHSGPSGGRAQQETQLAAGKRVD